MGKALFSIPQQLKKKSLISIYSLKLKVQSWRSGSSGRMPGVQTLVLSPHKIFKFLKK
jgi:hypothetical protein